jgi:hypothetical protein
VVVDDLDVLRPGRGPPETDPPLVINADAVLASTVTFECLQPVAWWNAKVIQDLGSIRHGEFAQRDPLQVTVHGFDEST